MKVRNKPIDKKEYKGRLTIASDKMCPCRKCWSPHDCGYRLGDGKWETVMRCMTNHDSGCPTRSNGELDIPIHVIRSKWENRKRGQTRICLRCGQKVTLGEINFLTIEAYKLNQQKINNVI